ncbi:MAG: glutamate racemase [Acidimicrobiia bacterium]
MIGMFDSGVGGLSVLAELRRLHPRLDVLYLADSAHALYSQRPLIEVAELSHRNVEWLLAQGAEAIAIACNTASAAALNDLRRVHPAVSFVGMEPAVKPARAYTRSGVIGVLATEATFQGELFASVVGRFADGVEIVARSCSGWADLVEAGKVAGPEVEAAIAKHLDPVLEAGADTLVLGCTHYPFLLPVLHYLAGAQVVIVDPAPAVARQIGRLATGRGSGRIRIRTTGDAAQVQTTMHRLTGWDEQVSAIT